MLILFLLVIQMRCTFLALVKNKTKKNTMKNGKKSRDKNWNAQQNQVANRNQPLCTLSVLSAIQKAFTSCGVCVRCYLYVYGNANRMSFGGKLFWKCFIWKQFGSAAGCWMLWYYSVTEHICSRLQQFSQHIQTNIHTYTSMYSLARTTLRFGNTCRWASGARKVCRRRRHSQ